jgi:cystinosin
MGYGKLVISFIKYIPAIYWNYQRKSTKGWPVLKVVMDFLGGALSLISGSAVDNGLNIAKVGLGILTLFYNLIFMLQAFILYPSRKNALEN